MGVLSFMKGRCWFSKEAIVRCGWFPRGCFCWVTFKQVISANRLDSSQTSFCPGPNIGQESLTGGGGSSFLSCFLCLYGHVQVYMCVDVHMESKGDIMYLPCLFFTLYFETGLLTEPGAHRFN